ncbi:universal stress protein [Nocardioides ultimimeridianus]
MVGVDGSDAALVAVRYAAAEARRTGVALELVHAAPQLGPLGLGLAAAYRVSTPDHRVISTRMLNHARTVAREVAGDGWDVRTRVLDGPAAGALADASSGASAVVVGHHRRTVAERALTGSVVAALAGIAPVPLVVVPDTWRAGVRHGRVAIAVRDPEGAEDAVRQAFRIAADRDAALDVVHAWELPMTYADVVATRPGAGSGHAGSRARFERLLERAGVDRSSAGVAIRLIRGRPARVLEDVSRQVDLLVLVRRHHGIPSGHLGSTGRAVIRTAGCPVQVLEERQVARGTAAGPDSLDPELV